MKYQVTFSCGHDGKVEVFGPNSARQYKIDQASSGLCPECLADARAQRSQDKIDQAEAAGLPKLEGSEKQVAWATSIRAQMADEFAKIEEDNDMEYVVDQLRFEHKLEVTEEQAREAFQRAMRCNSAKLFIDNRSDIVALIANGVR